MRTDTHGDANKRILANFPCLNGTTNKQTSFRDHRGMCDPHLNVWVGWQIFTEFDRAVMSLMSHKDVLTSSNQ